MDIASLGLRIDTGQVATGVKDLNNLTAAGAAAEKSAEKVGTAWTGASQRLGDALATTVTQARASQAAVTGLAAATGSAAQAATVGTKQFGAFAAGQKLTAYQSQQLTFQLNDLFVQIASGQSPLTALIQQGSQLSGTFGGIRGTVAALGSAIGGTAAIIGSLVASVAAVGAAYLVGSNQSADFQKSIALTGNAAGITEGQFNSLAKSVSASTETSIGSTRETLQALVSSGRFTGGALASAASATQNLARVTGQSSDDIVADFVKMSNGVARWAEETNRRYNFLTAAQIQYIRTLEDQGNSQRAIEVTLQALNGRLDVAAGNLGILERAWNGVKSAASGAIDAMLQIGRAQTPEAAVADLEQRLAKRERLGPLNESKRADFERENASLRTQIASQKQILTLGEKTAKASAEGAASEQAKIAFLRLQDQSLSRSEQRVKELAKANALADKAGASPADRAKVIASINERFKDPKGPSGPRAPDTARADARAALLLQIEDVKTAGDALVAATSNTDRILEAKKQANLLSDQAYYAEKVALIRESTSAQVDALEKENALLEAQKLNTADGLARDREVLKNKARIGRLRADETASIEVLGLREQKVLADLRRAYEESQAAAESYLEAVSRASKRETEGFGQGQKSRDFTAGISGIEDRFESQRQALQRDNRNGRFKDREEDFRRELALINSTQAAEIAIYRAKFATLNELQKNYSLGASEALQNYIDQSEDGYARIGEAVTNAFRGMEDALVTFITTGKGGFKGLANAIVADITRIIVQQQISNAIGLLGGSGAGGGGLGGLIGAGFSALFGGGSPAGTISSTILPNILRGGRAEGGSVTAGGIYPVSERGPELLTVKGKQYLMTGNEGGRVTPMSDAGSSNPSINLTLNQNFAPGTDRRTVDQAAASAGQKVQRAMARNN